MFGDGLMFMQWLYYDCPAESVYEQFLLCRRITGCLFCPPGGAGLSLCRRHVALVESAPEAAGHPAFTQV